MSFTIRTTKPNKGDKFYNNSNNGGYSWCVNGYPKDSGCNVLSNCVGYACGRFNEIIGSMKYKTLCCNAERFIEKAKEAGLSVGTVPKVGAIMCWQKGATLNGSDGAGHVAIVEKVYDNNHVYTSESAYGGTAFYNAHRYNNNGSWGLSNYKFRGFIYNPSVIDEPIKPILKSNEQVAEEVIAGKWGVGQDRKNRLANAGYNYTAVQAIVSKLLGDRNSRKTNEQIAEEVLNNKWGNGQDRKNRLAASGYDYNIIQAIVNDLDLTRVAKEVIARKWGDGLTRRLRLKRAGYNPIIVQARVNKLLRK